jgi:hypothetical protein
MLGQFAKKPKSFARWLALFSWSASLMQFLQEAAESALYFPTAKQATTKQALGGDAFRSICQLTNSNCCYFERSYNNE